MRMVVLQYISKHGFISRVVTGFSQPNETSRDPFTGRKELAFTLKRSYLNLKKNLAIYGRIKPKKIPSEFCAIDQLIDTKKLNLLFL